VGRQVKCPPLRTIYYQASAKRRLDQLAKHQQFVPHRLRGAEPIPLSIICRDSMLMTPRPMSVWRYADTRLRGRPPLAPLVLEAAAFAFDRRRPPRRPVAAANKRVPNTRSTRPET
jgi:hypothetical protein